MPPFGEYTWRQTVTNAGTLAIIINASISSELPYTKRNITVKLGSEIQSRIFDIPLKSVEFEFDGLDLKPQDYPFLISYKLFNDFTADFYTATNTLNETVRTSTGNKRLISNCLFLILLIVFVSL